MPTRPDRRRGRVIVAWLPLLVALLFAAPAATTPASAAPVAPAVPAAVLTPCPGQPGYQCGTVAAPIDEAHPDGPTVALAVIRRPAAAGAAALGTIFFNPGGPGESGVSILPVYAGMQVAVGAMKFGGLFENQLHHQFSHARHFLGAILCLLVSGLLRLGEFFVTRGTAGVS